MPKMQRKLKKAEAKNANSAKIAEIVEIAKISDTEIARFRQTFEIWVFFGKIDGLFEKSLNFIQNL